MRDIRGRFQPVRIPLYYNFSILFDACHSVITAMRTHRRECHLNVITASYVTPAGVTGDPKEE
ncbi:MAG TPA: hypothetical protein VHT03_03180 [Rhizomicrobium sp.]|nr:hypothetical protein [Rhizomicrobium sp.]